ncbi:hypothetical protein E8E14_009234 [Neopestalotiopsis sp. 37M]|nr:hypothetical protein E8E14_009234 [Neopestalotiopsis sp. 37M]
MSFFARIFTLPNLTLAATFESLVVIKFLGNRITEIFPQFDANNHIGIVAVVFAVNYVFALFFWGLLYPKLLSPLRHLPGPRSVISAAHRSLLVVDRPPGDLFLDIIKKYPGEELLSLTTLDSHILVAKPRLLADVLVHKAYDFVKPPNISGFLRYILGDGLIVVEGDQHKFLRKSTMPAFSFRHIKDLYPVMWGKAMLMTSLIQEEVSGVASEKGQDPHVIEVSPWASKATLDIIGVAGLGREFNMLRRSADPLLDVYEELLEPATEKLLFSAASFALGIRFIKLLPWKMNNLFDYLSRRLNEICIPMMKQKKTMIEQSKDGNFDVLSLLIKSGNFTDSELKDQLLTFLAAGHETTSSAFTWACYLLAKHQDLQQKLRDEVCEAFKGQEVDADGQTTDLGSLLEPLPYLNGVMNETLRLYPTVPITMRQAVRDTNIGGQQLIPKGVTLILSMWQMNRSPEVWGAEAGEFRPERWINPETGKPNSNGGAQSNYEFLTFLHGPRSCIGQGFAKAEMRCLLASMIRAFSWELAMDEAKILPRGVITIKPAHGLYIKLKPLDIPTSGLLPKDAELIKRLQAQPSALFGDPAFQRGPRSTGPTISLESGSAPLGRTLRGLQQPVKSTPDLSMLSLPLDYCISNHGSHCHIDQPEELYTTRMLDVVDRKVVPCPRNCDYIALSYVWGGVHPLPGALENRCLPQTIEDAITVTKALGRRYLWVDALCIDQSPNPTEAQKREKIKQLDMMSSIYGCATVTIIALVGKHADAGLPGISTPRFTQVKETIDGCTIFTGPQHLTLEQETATYSSRAWTYQEELLSRRVLTFTQSLVAFRCRVFDVDETMDTKTLKNSPVRDINSPSIADQPMPKPDLQKRMYHFSVQLRAYTSRRMTNEGDSLNAFRGVLSLLGDDLFPEGFIHGLPLRSHACSLGWMHSRDTKPKRRLEFPSWSWTGWEGTAMYAENLIDAAGQKHLSNTTKDLELDYLGCDNNYIDVEGWCVDIDIRTEPLSELFAPGQDESIGTVKEGDHKHNNTLKTGSYHCLIIQRVSERIKGRDMQREMV